MLRTVSATDACAATPSTSSTAGRAVPRRSSGRFATVGRSTLQPVQSVQLTPSMQRIAGRDKVVELIGRVGQAAFDVGGRHGNIVTSSRANTVHKGWRAVAVDGRPLLPSEVPAALAAAQRQTKYTVTFRIDAPLPDEEGAAEETRPSTTDALEAEEEARRRREAEAEEAERRAAAERERAAEEEARRRLDEEDEARRATAAAEAAARAEAEEAARRRRAAAAAEGAEAERRAAAAAAEAAAAEAERAKRRAEEAEAERARRKSEEEGRQAAAEQREQRSAAARRLERSTGLPPREDVADPQHALLEALNKGSQPSAPPKKKGGPCDKCDGPHHEDDCPHFKGKAREKHKDAWERYGAAGDGSAKEAEVHVLRSARIVPQPGDGSCLFHSLAYGLKGTSASELRAQIADYIAGNPDAVVAGNPLRDWVLWDAGTDVKSYGKTMRTGSRWGGAVEIAVCAQLHNVPVHVYERGPKGFTRISAFGGEACASGGRVVNVHYGGRVHYDAIETDGR